MRGATVCARVVSFSFSDMLAIIYLHDGQLHWTMMRSLVVAVEESAVLFCILTIAHVRALIRFSLDDPCDDARDGNPPINLLIMSFYSPKWT